jgi:hypothetical protein
MLVNASIYTSNWDTKKEDSKNIIHVLQGTLKAHICPHANVVNEHEAELKVVT